MQKCSPGGNADWCKEASARGALALPAMSNDLTATKPCEMMVFRTINARRVKCARQDLRTFVWVFAVGVPMRGPLGTVSK
jgi:hypothetical protein